MTNIQRIQLKPETTPLKQGRSSHGRWRYAYQRAGSPPEEGPLIPAALYVTQDSDRLAFALTDGFAAEFLAEYLVDYLWTREAADADWPQNLREWLTPREDWSAIPSGPTAFVCGRMERSVAGGRIYLAWLGMNGVRLLSRAHDVVTLDTVLEEGETWTPENGPEPVGMALHAYRGSLFDLSRLMVFTAAADPFGDDLADFSNSDLQQAVVDWSEEAERDLVVFDFRLQPVLTEPAGVVLTYQWIAPDLCLLSWKPSPIATGYRIEEAPTSTFEDAALLAELTDGRQVQYRITPPTGGARYYRVIPLNQSVPGAPSEPACVTPIMLSAPVLEPIRWAEDGGYYLSWLPLPQATSYEVQTSTSPNFEPDESQVLFRGDMAEVHLPADTPTGRYYRVRAINVLYAPHTPSPWSHHRRSPAILPKPIFIQVSTERLVWEPVAGAHQYAVRVTPIGRSTAEDEIVYTSATECLTSDQPAVYQVRALRRPNDQRTASEWSDPVRLLPGEIEAILRSLNMPFITAALIGVALVAILVGAALSAVGYRAFQERNATATHTPYPPDVITMTAAAAATNVQNATAVVGLSTEKERLQNTIQAQIDAEQTLTHIPTLTPSITLTPSNTPNWTATVENAFDTALTATADRWTNTPRPSATPNATETFQAAMSGMLTATETARPTPTRTPNWTATVSVVIDTALASTLTAQPSATPTPTSTPTESPSPTPNWTATVEVILESNLPAGCFVLNLPKKPLFVYTGPSTREMIVLSALPRLAEVIARQEQTTPEGVVVWLEVRVVRPDGAITGWIALPPDLDEADFYGGPDCQPDLHIQTLSGS